MTRFVYDQFAKDYLGDLLKPLGEVQTQRGVAVETQFIDVWFAPTPQPRGNAQRLGLLGSFTTMPAVIESFRNAATLDEICSCLSKLLLVRSEFRREDRRDEARTPEDELPRLWILTPTVSQALLAGFRATADDDNWMRGVYFLADHLRAAIVAIHQLPRTQETLWLRLLGRGRVQEQAIEEVKALPETDPRRANALKWLTRLEANLVVRQDLDEDDRRLIMHLLPLFEEQVELVRQEEHQKGLQQGLQQGQQQGQQQGLQQGQRLVVENVLRARFDSLDGALAAIIPLILELPPEEYAVLLLRLSNLSREQLLARFANLSEAAGEESSEIGETDWQDHN